MGTPLTTPTGEFVSPTGSRARSTELIGVGTNLVEGDSLYVNRIHHIITYVSNSGNVFQIRRFSELDIDTPFIDSDCTQAKKTKRKGTRFKPTVADRLSQSRNSKYGRN